MIYTTTMKDYRMNETRSRLVNGKLQFSDTNTYATILAEWTLSASAGTVTNGAWTVAAANSLTTILVTGTAAYARILDSGNVPLITDITVSVDGGGGEVQLSNTSLVATENLVLGSILISHGL